jgi:hypothetical protein
MHNTADKIDTLHAIYKQVIDLAEVSKENRSMAYKLWEC